MIIILIIDTKNVCIDPRFEEKLIHGWATAATLSSWRIIKNYKRVSPYPKPKS